ncbi:MAG: hypothetical protein ABIG89_00050 [Candidatus Woesearchaeota archaeon]
MAGFPIETIITPSDVSVGTNHLNTWMVKYVNPEKVKDFLQDKGLRDQHKDRDVLAEALLAGLLPEIFSKVFETGARPKSGFPCHDGEITDNSRDDVVVVYHHGQSWNHYERDPIHNGLPSCYFGVKIIGASPLFVVRDWKQPEQLLKIVFGDRFEEVKHARADSTKADSTTAVSLERGILTSNIVGGRTDHYTHASLEMYPVSPLYDDISQAAELYRKVVGIVRGNEASIKRYSDLVQQGIVAEGLLAKISGTAKDFSTAFEGIGIDQEYGQKLESVCGFFKGKIDFLREHVTAGKQQVLEDLTKAFEPIRDELVSYFTTAVYSTNRT